MKKTLALLAIAMFLFSCSPKVTTSIASLYTPVKESEYIAVYGVKDNVYQKAEKLGTVSIGDTGFSTNCGYDKVISLAKAEARKAGGNALKITEHKEPNIWTSSCHRITADILRIHPFSMDAVNSKRDSSINVYSNSKITTNDQYNPLYSNNEAVVEPEVYSKFKISAGIGGGYRINKLADGLSSAERNHIKKMKWGLNMELGGEYYITKFIGVGVASSWFRSAATFAAYDEGYSYDIKDRINLFYVGPKVVFRGAENQGWFIDLSLGYLGYHQKLTTVASGLSNKLTGGCVGGIYGFGYDINISESLGLVLKLSMTSGVLSKVNSTLYNGVKETIKFPKDQKEGLSRIDLTIGIRFQK